MAYAAVTSRRMPYDIDGTEIGYNTGLAYESGITAWLSSGNKATWNKFTDHISSPVWSGSGGTTYNRTVWFFFPEKREIEAMILQIYRHGDYSEGTFYELQGSNDTTNGMDGTWETATFPNGSPFYNSYDIAAWRSQIKTVSFSSSYKVIRLRFHIHAHVETGYFYFLHFYGRKAAGETPDDILVLDNELETPAEFTALKDWGDRPEGTTVINSVRLKNDSATKIANNVNIQLNNADYLMSWDQITWAASLDIATLTTSGTSSPIYIKNALGVPLLTLGPRAARMIITVGSWTA